MNRDNERQSAIILSVIGIIPVVWLALLIAPSVKGGLPEILPSLLTAFNNPFHIELCEDSLKTVLVLLLCYAMGIGIYFSTQKNYRRREEHGSAKWGNARAVNKKYRQSPASANKLMTQNVCIGLNAKKHRRNLNTLVCGGSGAGKTRFYCKPNLMQCNTSFVISTPVIPPISVIGVSYHSWDIFLCGILGHYQKWFIKISWKSKIHLTFK